MPFTGNATYSAGVTLPQFAEDVGTACFRVAVSFQRIKTSAFGDHDSISFGVERSRCLGRVFVGGQCVLAVETCEDTERVNKWFEQCIAERPEQYMWVHRRFKTLPPNTPSVY